MAAGPHLASSSSRWQCSESTFGPTGRVLATFLVLLPVWYFLLVAFLPAGWVVLVLYAYPLQWALRDIWARTGRS